MKDLIVYTDFSPPAKNAAEFALRMAVQTGSGLVLCNARGDCEEKDRQETKKYSVARLGELKKFLVDILSGVENAPAIRLISSVGSLLNLANRVERLTRAGINILGIHHAGLLAGFGLGHRYDELTGLNNPVLLVPGMLIQQLPCRIAFLTDLVSPERDTNLLWKLAPVIKTLQAAIYLIHVNLFGLSPQDSYHRGNSILRGLESDGSFREVHLFSIEKRYLSRELELLLEGQKIDLLIMITSGKNLIGNKFLDELKLEGFYNARVPLFMLCRDREFAL